MKEKGVTSIALGIIVLAVIVTTTTFYYFGTINTNSKSNQTDVNPTPSTTIKSTSSIVSSKSPSAYYLQISLKSPEKAPPSEQYYFLSQYLQNALNLYKGDEYNKEISKIVYDTRKENPYKGKNSKYNSNYYIMLKEKTIEAPKTYEDEYTTINVSPVEASLESYINNPDYCITDNDCTIRSNFCTYGSFNYYHPFHDVWGCGPPSDETDYTFYIYDEKMGCDTQVTYEGSKCKQNQCVGQNRKVFCQKK